VGRLDLEAIRELAVEQWFWARFLERLGIALPPGAVPTGPAPRATHRRTAA
jgi:hypothetical protein